MKKKKMPVSERMILTLILTTGTLLIGTTYAGWTQQLNITVGATTGEFNMIFPEPDEEQYQVAVTDAQGNVMQETDAEVTVTDEGKAVRIVLSDGILLELLLEGDYLRLTYPIRMAEDSSFGNVKLYEPDFGVSKETVWMEPDDAVLLVDGNIYNPAMMLEEYEIPLEFEVYRGMEREGEKIWGSLFLKLTGESMDEIRGMPDTLELEEEELEGYQTDLKGDWDVSGESGVMVTYACTATLYLDQAVAEPSSSGKRKSPFGITAYAYWTDRMAVAMTAPMVYPVEVTILEPEEEEQEGAEEVPEA